MTTTDEPATRTSVTRRWLVGPPGWVFGGALLLTVVISVYAVSAPGGIFDFVLFAVGAWVVLIGVFGVRLIVSLAVADDRPPRRTIALWFVFPVVLVASFAVASSGAPGRLGLAAAKGDMLAFAGDPNAADPERVGPYRVLVAERLPGGGAQFSVEGAGFLDVTGWAYSPGAAPRSVPHDITYTRITGDWYEFVRTF